MFTKEIKKLAALLLEEGINFKISHMPKEWDGAQILIFDEEGVRNGDVICHKYSHGYKDGLLEYMGQGVPTDHGDDVVGWLTATKAFEMVMDGLGRKS